VNFSQVAGKTPTQGSGSQSSLGTADSRGRLVAERHGANGFGLLDGLVDAEVTRRRPVSRIGRDSQRRYLLAVGDGVAVAVAGSSLAILIGRGEVAAASLLMIPGWILLAKLFGLYDHDHRALRHLTSDEYAEIFVWSFCASAMTATFVGQLTATGLTTQNLFLLFWPVAYITSFALRGATRALWRRLAQPERAVIVGRGEAAALVRRKLELFEDIHVEVVAQVGSLPIAACESDALGGVDRVILATEALDDEGLGRIVALCRRKRIKLDFVPSPSFPFARAVQLDRLADLQVLGFDTAGASRSTLLLKRNLDVAVSASLLVLLLPLFILVALLIWIDSPGPVLFVQRRAGLDGRPFRMLKFRTMDVDAERRLSDFVDINALAEPMFKLERDPRVTRVGSLLRRLSVDELPQLVNVLLGNMSLVGPRPEQLEIVEHYRPEHRFRLSVKPGVTGPMQVFGRGALTFAERLSVEGAYIEGLSIGADLHILAKTLAVVARGRGAY
jgi:exopolysaccharide biosynthesis polyprenyl glycosylphosphotransferase